MNYMGNLQNDLKIIDWLIKIKLLWNNVKK